LLISSGLTIAAQQATPSFDVASIKPARERALPSGVASPDRFHVSNYTLRRLIEYAYAMPQFRILGGPAWMESERWEVSARADRIASPEEKRAMVRQLMAERFQLKAHLETRELATYTLVHARGDRRLGSNMRPAVIDCEPFHSDPRSILEAPADTRRRCTVSNRVFGGGVLTMRFNGTTTTRLAAYIETRLGRVVVDRTDLAGSFDIELTYEDERFLGSSKRREAPPLPIALQDQLGLRLVASRGPVGMLVIDSAERPTPD
jgi:uncharacterized protein (TIGR03435 family)